MNIDSDKLRFAMIPSGYKAGTLYSQFPNVSESDFDVVRNSIGTRVNKDGLIEVVDANVPRLDYSDGGCPKLLTEVGSNIDGTLRMKQWTKQNVTTEAFTDLMGGQDAVKVASLGGGVTSIYFDAGGINDTRTFSFYCKKGNSQYITFQEQFTGYFAVTIDLDNLNFHSVNGSGYQGGRVTRFNNEWIRVEVIATIGTSDSLVSVSPHININSPQGNYCYLWGYQQESNSSLFATSYTPTNGSAIIRQADQVSNAGNSSTFNSQSGVLFAEVKTNGGSNIKIIDVYGSANERARLSIASNIVYGYYNNAVNGNNVVCNIPFELDTTLQNKFAFLWSEDDFKLYVNGLFVGKDTSGDVVAIGTFNKISLESFLASNPFFGKTKSVQHYDYLTNVEMEQLTGYQSYAQMTQQFQFNTL